MLPFEKDESERSIGARFERVAEAVPERVAVRDARGSLTYAELRRLVDRVASAVLSAGTGGEPVGLLLDHRAGAIAAILGVLRSGHAWVPLDPAYPTAQLREMVADAGARLILVEAATAGLAAEIAPGLAVLDVDDLPEDTGTVPDRGGPGSPACILYTSGSTGKAKGTLHDHRSILHLVWSHVTTFSISPDDRLALVVSLAYSASLSEIFSSLLSGASLSLAHVKRLGVGPLEGWIRDEGITVLKLPVAVFRSFLGVLGDDARFPTVRLVVLGGDALFRKDVERARRHFPRGCRLLSRLASTETLSTTRMVIEEGTPLPDAVVPVGYPDHDTEVLILDDEGRPLGAGEVGQIAVRSRYLSPGYWRRDDLNRRCFTRLGGDDRPVLLTGDVGRLRPDGCLEHFGRQDGMVKVRGHRVEPSAIEAALGAIEGVREAAVAVVRAGEEGTEKRLVAYLSVDGQAPTPAELRAALGASLPDAMVPSTFVVLAQLPRTATGKIDRQALPAPAESRPTTRAPTAEARTDVERRVAALWREVLGLQSVGVGENFFDLGGDSLQLLRLHAALGRELGSDMTVLEMFRHPTVAAMARRIVGGVAAQRALRPGEQQGPAAPGRGDVAIVGMAGVFPGARDIDELWRNLREGREAIRALGDDELREAGVDEAALADPAYVRVAPELPDFRRIDAAFFGLPPVEAAILDPQHRMLLECACRALDHAGQDPARFAGRIGVFAGASQSAYLQQHLLPRRAEMPHLGDLQLRLACDPEFLATRVAYKLDLRGPAVNVNTACSTSLVAVHLACRALLDGDCEMALAGGASVESPEAVGHRHEEGWICSPDGRCRPFDAEASGTVFGSGAGVVVLKLLSRAIEDGDAIHAVIRGSAVNNDGGVKVGFAAPSVEGQAAVIAEAQARAGVHGEGIDYVEAHGTGTPLGDPIEVAALRLAFAGAPAGRCAIGSLKASVGHLSRAAGVAGLIKTVLALEHGEIPPSLGCTRPNPRLDLARSPFYVNTALRPWPVTDGRPRRAAVSSFGVGGTNAHVILEEWREARPAEDGPPWQLLPLSTRTRASLATARAALAQHLQDHPEQSLADVAFTLQAGRREHEWRACVVARDRAEAVSRLRAEDAPLSPSAPPAVVFLFPGQGAQYPGMTRGIYECDEGYRADVDRCAALLLPRLGVDLRDLLLAPDGDVGAGERLRQTRMTQPALLVTELCLARLWQRWGVQPDAMIGHSIGEHAAACLAGVLGLEETLELVAERGRLLQDLPAGRMMAVHLGEAELTEILPPSLALAAVNAPRLCIVAGEVGEADSFARALAAREVDVHILRTSHAFHSAMMDPVLAGFTEQVARHSHRRPARPYVSGVSGTWIGGDEAVDPAYWSRLLRGTVRFSDGIRTLGRLDRPLFLEVGPGCSLGTLVRQHPDLADRPVVATTRAAGDRRADREVLLRAAGDLWLRGVRLDGDAMRGGRRRRRAPLPGYPFERREHWIGRPMQRRGSPAAVAAAEAVLEAPAQTDSVAAPPVPTERERILGAPREDRRSLVSAHLLRTVNTLLGHPADRPLPDAPLGEVGIDSLASIRLRTVIEGEFGQAPSLRVLAASPLSEIAARITEGLG